MTPGLVDIHAHVIGTGDVDVDGICGAGAGVTSIIDAGSAMASDLPGALEVSTPSTVYSLLTNHNWPDGFRPPRVEPVDVDAVREAMQSYPGTVLGIKVALTPAIIGAYGLDGLSKARAVAAQTGTRVMLHIGDIGNPALDPTPSSITSEALGILQAGDILTHVYSPLTGGPLDENERLLPALGEACERGVIMDAAKGDYGFGWEAADQILGTGIKPDTVSSDVELHSPATGASGLMVENRRATGARIKSELSLVEYMAFFLALGFGVDEVVRMVTSAPAAAAGIADRAGDLCPGKPADVSVLEIKNGRYRLTDVDGVSRTGQQAFVPFATLKDGNLHEPSAGPHEWGFEPPPAN